MRKEMLGRRVPPEPISAWVRATPAGRVMRTPVVVELLVLLPGGSMDRPWVSHSMMKVLEVLAGQLL